MVEFKLYGKIIWKYRITAETGLHIGGASSIYDIGAPDNPVVKNPITGKPYIPGSSLKGKLRSLLERKYLDLTPVKQYHRGELNKEALEERGWTVITVGKDLAKHVVYFADCNKNKEVDFICKLFGSPGGKAPSEPPRLIISDADAVNWDSNKELEVKGENTLDRVTSAANPRFTERVPAGTVFEGVIVFNVYSPDDSKLLEKLKEAFELLVRDYIGGSGTRGYGRISIWISKPEFYPADFLSKLAENKTDGINNKWATLEKRATQMSGTYNAVGDASTQQRGDAA